VAFDEKETSGIEAISQSLDTWESREEYETGHRFSEAVYRDGINRMRLALK
jgi:hypothetical protein